MTTFRALVALLFLSVLISGPSPSFAQTDWTPVDPKHDDPVVRTPAVCMMYHFGTDKSDPLYPGSYNNLAIGTDGNIYGASSNGGCAACHGMVFQMTPDGEFSIKHVFNGIDGDGPSGGLAGSGDLFYGTTYGGGKVEYSYLGKGYTKYNKTGTIFSYSAGSNGITPVWSFRNGWLRRVGKDDPPHTEKEKKDAPGSYPVSAPVTNLSGQTMGVTSYAWNQRYGSLYSLEGGFTAVENMDGSKALKLYSLSPGVTDNNFYGTAAYGSKGHLHGAIFKTSGGPLEVIHEFNGDDGSGPTNVIQGKDKKLYGTTYWGGMYKHRLGVLYQMNADGSDYKIFHHFNGAQGSQPVSALVWGKDNKLYGTARFGGTGGSGLLYRIDRDGKNYTVLHNFKMYITGRAPLGNMVQHKNGYFYGTTSLGGRHNGGGIFRLDVGYAHQEAMEPAGSRWCCSLGQGLVSSTILDPSQLKGHKYGTQKFGDPVGFVYTNRAGLLDIGHVRDMIDLTRYIYFWLMTSDRNNLALKGFPDGFVRPIQLPMNQDEVLRLAGAMAYMLGLSHELITWKMYFHKDEGEGRPFSLHRMPQDWSSFSPEDLVSNMVGIVIAWRVLQLNCEKDFDEAVDIEMEKMMKEIDAQPAEKTQRVLDYVEGFRFGPKNGKWFTENSFWETLWRRNFYANPWLVPYENLGAYRPKWLNTRVFEPYYKYFDFVVKTTVEGENGIFMERIYKKVEEMRLQYEKDYPGITKWP